ncbi:F-box/WD domain containing protein [Entamoeba marina]
MSLPSDNILSNLDKVVKTPYESKDCLSTWTSQHNEKQVKLNHSTIKISNGTTALRTQTYLPFTAQEVFNMVNSSTIILENDPLILRFQLLESISPSTIYYEIKTAHGIFLSDEFCLKRTAEKTSPSKFTVINKTTSHPRSHLNGIETFGLHAMVIEDSGDGCVLTIIQQLPNNKQLAMSDILFRFTTFATKRVRVLKAYINFGNEVGKEKMLRLANVDYHPHKNEVEPSKRCHLRVEEVLSNSSSPLPPLVLGDETKPNLKEDKISYIKQFKEINKDKVGEFAVTNQNNNKRSSGNSNSFHNERDSENCLNETSSEELIPFTHEHLKHIGNGKLYSLEGSYKRVGIFPTSIESVITAIMPNSTILAQQNNVAKVKNPLLNQYLTVSITFSQSIIVMQMFGGVVHNSTILITTDSVKYTFSFFTTTKSLPDLLPFIQTFEKNTHSLIQPQPIIQSYQHPQPQPSLTTVNPQIFKVILNYLQETDKLNLSQTCKHIRRIILSLKSHPLSAFMPSVSDFQPLKQTPKRLDGHTNFVRSLDVAPNMQYLVTGASDRKVRLWTLPTPTTNTSKVFTGPNSSVVSSTFLKDTLVVAYKCGTVKYIPLSEPDRLLTFDIVGGKIEGFMPLTGTAFVAWNEKVQLINYHHLHQAVLFTYSEHLRKITTVRPYGSKFVSGSTDRSIHIWDPNLSVPTIEKIRNVKTTTTIEVIDENIFVSGGESIVQFWDGRKVNEPFHKITLDSKVSCLCHHNNKLVIGSDKGVTIRSGANWENENVLMVNDNSGVSCVKLLDDMLAAGFRDGGINIWDFPV